MVSIYEQEDARRASYVVRIGEPFSSGPLEVIYSGAGADKLLAMAWSYEVDRVPTMSLRIRNPPPSHIARYGSPVLATVGLSTTSGRSGTTPSTVFRGIVFDYDRDDEGTTYQCVGRSWPLDANYQKVLAAPTLDVNLALAQLVLDAGISFYTDINVPLWTLGSVVQQTLEFATFGEAIRKLIEPDDSHWWEDRVGNVHIRQLTLQPSLTAVRKYFAMQLTGIVESYPAGIAAPLRPRIRRAARAQAVRETKNHVFVRGATVTTTDGDGQEVSADIEAEVQADSPYVRKPDGSQAYSDYVFNNELIDTQAKADQVAQTHLNLQNVLHETVGLTIDGDPRVALGETVEVNDPDYSGIVGRYIIKGYTTTMDENDFSTQLNLVGGGTSNNDPIAVFTYRVEREVFDDQVYAFVTFDARESYDLDGTIASYAWSDNQTPEIATGSEPVFTVSVDPASLVEPWEVTLEVTDDIGATSTFTLTVEIGEGGPFTFNPGFTVAFDNHFSGTPNGGQIWYDQTGTSVISTAVGDLSLAPGIAVFGTSAGGIWRTTDYCFTAPTQVMANVGSPIVDLNWDKNATSRVWAITEGGNVYRSDDAGVTWVLWDSLALPLATAGRITTITLRRMDTTATGIRVYGRIQTQFPQGGGLTIQPLIATDALLSHSWIKAVLKGDLADDYVAGYPIDIMVADGAAGQESELAIILNGTGVTTAVYFTDDVTGGTRWQRATGQPAKARGRYIVQDLELGKFVLAYDDTVIYRGDVDYGTGVMAVTTAPAALDANDTPNHTLWVGERVTGMAGVYLVSAEGTADGTVYKTFDRFETIGKIRPATGFEAAVAGMNAKMAALGPSTAPTPAESSLLVVQSPQFSTAQRNYARRVASLTGGLWSLISDPAAATQDLVTFMRRFGTNLFRGQGVTTTHSAMAPGQLQRSTDGGATWSDVGPAPQVNGTNRWGTNAMCRAADGALWLVATPNDGGDIDATLNFPRIYKSIDQGATWSQIYEDTTVEAGIGKRIMSAICAHPTDANRVFVIGSRFNGVEISYHTLDGGSTWTDINYAGAGAGCEGYQETEAERRCVMLSSGRVVELAQPAKIAIIDPGYACADNTKGSAFSGTAFVRDLIRVPGDVLFAAGGTALAPLVKRSTDGGITWATIVDGSSLSDADVFGGLWYDEIADTLYIVTESSAAAQRIYRLPAATQPTVGTLADITLNLDDLFTDADPVDESIGLRGVTI